MGPFWSEGRKQGSYSKIAYFWITVVHRFIQDTDPILSIDLIPVYITRLIKYEIHLWKIWSKSINNVDSIPLAMHYTMQHKINLCSSRFSAFYSISFESVIDVMIQYNVDKCITKWYIYIYILKRYILLFDDVPYSLYRTCTYEW